MEPCRISQPVDRIVAYVARSGRSHLQIALEAEIAPNSLKLVGEEDWNPTLRVLRAIEAVIPQNFDPETPDGGKRRKGRK